MKKEKKLQTWGYKLFKPFLGFLFKIYYKPIIINKENIPLKGPIIICANHIHILDQCSIIISTKRVIHYMAKKEYFDGPYKWFFKITGCIPVNRQIKDKNASDLAIDVLNKEGAIGIFPEGTRNKTNEFSYHDIAPSTDKESNEEILNDYYNDVDNQEFSYTIKGTNNNDIFLVTTGEYYEESFNIPCYKVFKHILEDGIDKYKSNININEYYKYYKKHKNKTVTLKEMDGIINIPESLYDYHRFIDFLNGTISSMNKKEIESLLPLFKMSKEIVKKFDIEEVQKLDKDIKKYMGLNNHICEKLEEKCHHSEKILSLVKKN